MAGGTPGQQNPRLVFPGQKLAEKCLCIIFLSIEVKMKQLRLGLGYSEPFLRTMVTQTSWTNVTIIFGFGP